MMPTLYQGKLPEWSIGPHSKCGVRATVPGVRIPHFPQNVRKMYSIFYGYFYFMEHGNCVEIAHFFAAIILF